MVPSLRGACQRLNHGYGLDRWHRPLTITATATAAAATTAATVAPPQLVRAALVFSILFLFVGCIWSEKVEINGLMCTLAALGGFFVCLTRA